MTESIDQLALDDLTVEELRPVLVESLLNHVPFDGWTQAALAQAASPQEWNTYLLASPDFMHR